MPPMSAQSDLLAEIEAFLPHRGIKETTFGLLAVNDGKFVPRLRSGANMTLATLAKARTFLDAEQARLANAAAAPCEAE